MNLNEKPAQLGMGARTALNRDLQSRAYRPGRAGEGECSPAPWE